jgi:CRISPR/Cas system-associated exonuclease Cas4 (RecB family)
VGRHEPEGTAASSTGQEDGWGVVTTGDGWLKKSYTRKQPLVGKLQRHFKQISDARNDGRDTEHLHPSEVCKPEWCARSSWYRITGAPAKETKDSVWWRLANVFEEGHALHDKYQTALWELGVLEGLWQCDVCLHDWWALAPVVCPACAATSIKYVEVPIELPDLHMIGNADGIVDDDGDRYAIEIKSIGLGTLQYDAPDLYQRYLDSEVDLMGLWKSIKTPLPVHQRQGMLYLRALAAQGITDILFIYEFKANQDIKAFRMRYRPKTIEPIEIRAKEVKRALEVDGTVDRPRWAGPGHKTCKSCPYHDTCWSEDADPA